jgi:uncharacterized repeat protein (TIGR03803 family)
MIKILHTLHRWLDQGYFAPLIALLVPLIGGLGGLGCSGLDSRCEVSLSGQHDVFVSMTDPSGAAVVFQWPNVTIKTPDGDTVTTNTSSLMASSPQGASFGWSSKEGSGVGYLRASIPSGTTLHAGTTTIDIRCSVVWQYAWNPTEFGGGSSVTITAEVRSAYVPPSSPVVSAQAPEGFEVLARFGSDGLAEIPVTISLLEGGDGRFYGVTQGAATNTGNYVCAIVCLEKEGSSGRNLHEFVRNKSGLPNPDLARIRLPGATQDSLVGTTSAGGAFGRGTIFRMNMDGSDFATVYEFTSKPIALLGHGTVTDGRYPMGGLTVDSKGFLYGATVSGGQDDGGVIFRIWYDGSGYTLLRSLPPRWNAASLSENHPIWTPVLVEASPVASVLFPLSDFYSDQGQFHGQIGRIDFDGGCFKILADLPGPTFTTPYDSTHPKGLTDLRSGLLAAHNGKLYGTHGISSSKLPADSRYPSFIYAIDPNSSGYQTVTILSTNQTPDCQVLVEGSDRCLYGFLFNPPELSRLNRTSQILFALDPDTGLLNTIYDFVGECGASISHADAFAPSFGVGGLTSPSGALVTASDGAIYGTAANASTSGRGLLFRYVPPARPPVPLGIPASLGETTPLGSTSSNRPLAQAMSVLDSNLAPPVEMTVPTNYPGMNVGRSLAMNGDWLFVGVPFDNDASYLGAVQVFRNGPGGWTLDSTLRPATNDPVRLFGFSVSLSQDAAVIGAPGIFDRNLLAGSAYVFRRHEPRWELESRLAGPGIPGDEFGAAVAIDADRVLIGATGMTNAGAHTGRAFLFQRTNSAWVSVTNLSAPSSAAQDYFGGAVAMRGTNVLIGAPSSQGFSENFKPGAAYLYNLAQGRWVFRTNLVTLRSYTSDLFGASVGIGDGFFVVGAPGRNPLDPLDPRGDRRAVYVFNQAGVESDRLTPEAQVKLEMFGACLNLEGTRILVGAPRAIETNSPPGMGGASYLFDRRSSGWDQRARLVSSHSQRGDLFGLAVAVAGDWAAVSSILHANTNALLGSVSAFYVPSTSAPRLSLAPVATGLQVSWPTGFEDFQLETSLDLKTSIWQTVTLPIATNSFRLVPSNRYQYFRLRR